MGHWTAFIDTSSGIPDVFHVKSIVLLPILGFIFLYKINFLNLNLSGTLNLLAGVKFLGFLLDSGIILPACFFFYYQLNLYEESTFD